MSPEVRGWDALSYDRVSGPMQAMGEEVVARLRLSGGETVLDAGCGTGRVTAALLERLPQGRVIAVDASAEMIAVVRSRLRAQDEAIVADLSQLELPAPADAVLSTATFHWIADHAALFARLRAALKPGGQLEAQCGGAGNVAELHARAREVGASDPFAQAFEGWAGPWNFAGPQETERRLLEAGFSEARCWLEARPVTPTEPLEYLETICLGAHLERLAPELRRPYSEQVLAGLGEPPEIDYVRLNISAVA